jgi:RimJ/RimL family protein N-acetyltransferase
MLTIRTALPGDEYRLAEVHLAAWKSAYAGLMPADFLAGLSVEAGIERWRRSLAEPTSGVTILVADVPTAARQPAVDTRDELAGIATIGPSRDDDADPNTGELWAINLHPAYWRRGIGTVLLAAAVDHLAAAGWRRATLWVLDGNLAARRFYERHGWAPDGCVKDDERPGFTLHELRYARTLQPDADRADAN